MFSILVVEDEHEIAEMLTCFFGKKGFAVSVRDTADQAIKAIEEISPDLVILDLHLYGARDGAEVFMFIKEHHSSIKTIITSGTIEEQVEVRGYKPDLFLKKPYSLKNLYERINSLLA